MVIARSCAEEAPEDVLVVARALAHSNTYMLKNSHEFNGKIGLCLMVAMYC